MSYWLLQSREKVFCCVEKAKGQLYKHEHGKGWVAKKTDGTLTIMGNDCANDKFGADSKIFQDIIIVECRKLVESFNFF